MNFDPVAPGYALLERLVFGQTLQRARTVLLDRVAPPRRALLIGDGDGRFSAELLQRFPAVEVDIVEPSAAMARIARRRCGAAAARVHWYQLPVQQFDPEERRWDLVVTQFVLDVLEQDEADALVSRLAPRTAEWLVAEFRPGVVDGLLHLMYWFFRLTTGLRVRKIPDYGRAFEAAGLQRLVSTRFWRGFITAELYGASSPGRRMSLVT